MGKKAKDRSEVQAAYEMGMPDATSAMKEWEEVDSWKNWHATDYLAVIETLKSQVEEIQKEWNVVSSGVSLQQEKLESLLQSFPGLIETATTKSLSMRVDHLEKLVNQLLSESQAQTYVKGTRRQFIILNSLCKKQPRKDSKNTKGSQKAPLLSNLKLLPYHCTNIGMTTCR